MRFRRLRFAHAISLLLMLAIIVAAFADSAMRRVRAAATTPLFRYDAYAFLPHIRCARLFAPLYAIHIR